MNDSAYNVYAVFQDHEQLDLVQDNLEKIILVIIYLFEKMLMKPFRV
jgi:hypothetical protein